VAARGHGFGQPGTDDEHVVLRCWQGTGVELRTPDLAQLALDPVADDRVPGRARHGEAESRLTGVGVARALEPVQRQESRRGRAALAVDGVEVARAGKAVLPLHRLRAEALAALRATALEDQAAGTRRHPGAEAVLALPPAHVWLIGPFHALERVKSARVFARRERV